MHLTQDHVKRLGLRVPPSREEERRYWRVHWLASLHDFCDADQQADTWGYPSELKLHCSFSECLCCYVDDLDIALSPEGYDPIVARGYISTEEAAIVSDFHQLLSSYAKLVHDWDDWLPIFDPLWHEIVQAAREAQETLLCILDAPEERCIVSGLLPWEHESRLV